MSKQLNPDVVRERQRATQETPLAPPPKYAVILKNDDFTPMDFDVEVLMRYFQMDVEKANQIMLTVHYQGQAVCGIFSAEIAETKVEQVTHYARQHEYPLLCEMQPV